MTFLGQFFYSVAFSSTLLLQSPSIPPLPTCIPSYTPFKSVSAGYGKFLGDIAALNVNKATKISATIFAKSNTGACTNCSSGNFYFVQGDNQINGGWFLYNNTTSSLQPAWYLIGTNGTFIAIQLTTPITDAAWHGISVAYDGSGNASGLHMWIDGRRAAVTNIGSASLTADINTGRYWTVGNISNSNGANYPGQLNASFNNLAVFTGYQFTNADAALQYCGGSGVDQSLQSIYSHCVGWWPLVTSSDTTTSFSDLKSGNTLIGVGATLSTNVP